jgi:ubiquinone/menaquinone biosynthesis C-methylase UbiE
MSFFMAAIYDRFMRQTEEACFVQWRAELLESLSGRVLEVGAGTGANLRHYPPTVTSLVLCEPDAHMRKKLAARVAHEIKSPERSPQIVDADAERLPFEDRSFDAVVCTLVLCSVADPARALGELRRVLVPGGRLVFIEHVAAHDNPSRLQWQRRIEPAWKHVAGNCHLTRETERAIRDAGFEVESLRRESVRKALPWVRPSIRGTAVNPR